jgi:hypothetical protein
VAVSRIAVKRATSLFFREYVILSDKGQIEPEVATFWY